MYTPNDDFKDAIRRLTQRNSNLGNNPDIMKSELSSKDGTFLFQEIKNEFVDNQTIQTVNNMVDDHGQLIGDVNEIVVCDCGCKVNAGAALQKVKRCVICRNINCVKHGLNCNRKSFCLRLKRVCLYIGLVYVLWRSVFKLMTFVVYNILAIRIIPPPQPSASAVDANRNFIISPTGDMIKQRPMLIKDGDVRNVEKNNGRGEKRWRNKILNKKVKNDNKI